MCSIETGWHTAIWNRYLKGNVVIPYSTIKGMKVKPMYEFRNDFPYFDNKTYTKFYKELDKYYEDMAFVPKEKTENIEYGPEASQITWHCTMAADCAK